MNEENWPSEVTILDQRSFIKIEILRERTQM